MCYLYDVLIFLWGVLLCKESAWSYSVFVLYRFWLHIQYRIVCHGDSWYAFLPVVFLVLIGFTIALPFTICVYMFLHRKNLYSMSVYQHVGFLYEPYNRSAPWWAIHDVILKMLLTGMLIYVPEEERAGIAVILCTVAIVNLNYFRPCKFTVRLFGGRLDDEEICNIHQISGVTCGVMV